MVDNASKNLGEMIRQQRILKPMTLSELSSMSGVSSSHLGRIERGERFPSAKILRKLAEPLGFVEEELLTYAGYLSPQPSPGAEKRTEETTGRIDPYVARVLSQEPPQVQRTVIGILTILKSIAKGIE